MPTPSKCVDLMANRLDIGRETMARWSRNYRVEKVPRHDRGNLFVPRLAETPRRRVADRGPLKKVDFFRGLRIFWFRLQRARKWEKLPHEESTTYGHVSQIALHFAGLRRFLRDHPQQQQFTRFPP